MYYFLFVKYLWIKMQVHHGDTAENFKNKTYGLIKLVSRLVSNLVLIGYIKVLAQRMYNIHLFSILLINMIKILDKNT